MESKHTKALWQHIFDNDGCRIYSDNFGAIANIPHIGKHKEEHEANAKLIASAPELLGALTELHKCAKIYGAFADRDDMNGKALAQAASAISKATL